MMIIEVNNVAVCPPATIRKYDFWTQPGRLHSTIKTGQWKYYRSLAIVVVACSRFTILRGEQLSTTTNIRSQYRPAAKSHSYLSVIRALVNDIIADYTRQTAANQLHPVTKAYESVSFEYGVQTICGGHAL